MPRMDGIKATRLIRKMLPQMKILSLSQYDIPKVVNEVEKADAAAFVSKLLVWDKRSFPDAEVRMVISPLMRNLDY
jgi:DNA-binding NarL/FixJ family response regulator